MTENKTNIKKINEIDLTNIKDIQKLRQLYKIIYSIYGQNGMYQILPITFRDKNPILKRWKSYEKEKINAERFEQWVKRIKEPINLALITGFNNILVYDLDHPKFYEKFSEIFREIFGNTPENKTFVVQTRKGYHVYLKVKEIDKLKGSKIIFRKKVGGEEIREFARYFGKRYVLIPPSIHPSGHKYKWIHNDNVQNILEVTEDQIFELERRMKDAFGVSEIKSSEQHQVTIELTGEQISKIVEYFAPYWKVGQRFKLCMGLFAILRRAGVSKQSALRVLEGLWTRYDPLKDPRELEQWKRDLERTYSKNLHEISYLYWWTEEGDSLFSKEEAFERAMEIYKMVGLSKTQIFKRGVHWVIKITYSIPKEEEDEQGNLFIKKVTKYHGLLIAKNRIEKRIIIKVEYLDPETSEIVSGPFWYLLSRESLTNKKIEFVSGWHTGKGVYVHVRVDDKLDYRGPLDFVIQRLKEDGILTGENVGQIIKALFSFFSRIDPERTIFIAPGIYLDPDNSKYFIPVLPDNEFSNFYFPANDQTLRWEERYYFAKGSERDYINVLKALKEYRNFLPEGIYYAIIGFAFISPFLPSITKISSIKPALYLIGPKASGKSTIARWITKVLYGTQPYLSSTVLDTSFRFDTAFSSVALPILFDDVEQLRTKEAVIGKLKSILTEDEPYTYRGLPSQRTKSYYLYAVPIFTANSDIFNLPRFPALKDRFIVLQFRKTITGVERQKFIKTMKQYVQNPDNPNFTIAPYLLRDLPKIINKNGGVEWCEGLFDHFYNDILNTHPELGTRDISKIALMLIGLRIFTELYKYVVGQDPEIDIEKAKEKIIEEISKELEETSEELQNLAYAILNTKEDIFIPEKDGCYIITRSLLKQFALNFKGLTFPRNLSELSELLSQYGDFIPKFYWVAGRSVRGIAIPKELIQKILGEYFEAEEIQKVENTICGFCGKKIDGKAIKEDEEYYHPGCYQQLQEIKGKIPEDLRKHVKIEWAYGEQCKVCKTTIEGVGIRYNNFVYHLECFLLDIAKDTTKEEISPKIKQEEGKDILEMTLEEVV